ncbi:lipid-A-disaccharide synthase, partial [Pseudoxanthomonas sp. SGD-10]
ALLPGSRKQEVNFLMPGMVSLVEKFPEYQFVIAGAPNFTKEDYDDYLQGKQLPIVFSATYDLLKNAHAAVVTSGTATLETALFNVPQIVVYKGNAVTISIAKLLIKIGFISLVNLIVDREIVKELIQEDCNSANLTKELSRILSGSGRTQMLADYAELHERMGEPGASSKAADLMLSYLK